MIQITPAIFLQTIELEEQCKIQNILQAYFQGDVEING